MNYPVMTDLYDLIERTYQHYDQESLPLYPPEMLRDLLLGLHSMCKGADFRFFNGHTNISSDRFLVCLLYTSPDDAKRGKRLCRAVSPPS